MEAACQHTVLERDEEDRHEDWEVVRRLAQAAVANKTVQPVECWRLLGCMGNLSKKTTGVRQGSLYNQLRQSESRRLAAGAFVCS